MPRRLALVLLILALPLSGCLSAGPSVMLVPHETAARPATVDPAAALAMVNEFRRTHGLPPLVLDGKLAGIAASHANAMASSDRLAHVLPGEGSFPARIMAGGYNAVMAAENVGAGYHDLDEAFTGWRASPEHRQNMLRRGVTQMGIAVAFTARGRFHNYWSMVLGAPDTKTAGGPQ